MQIKDTDEFSKKIAYINPYDVINEGAEVIEKYLDEQGITGEDPLLHLSSKQIEELIKIMEEYWDNNFVSDSFIHKLEMLKCTLKERLK